MHVAGKGLGFKVCGYIFFQIKKQKTKQSSKKLGDKLGTGSSVNT